MRSDPAYSALPSRLNGLLGFPLTPFRSGGMIDVEALRRHVDLLLSYGAGAIFPACGAGELWSLALVEYERIVRACVEEARGRVPVIPGIGFGYGLARELGLLAQRAGADGVLVFPPYLDAGNPAGQVAYYRHLAGQLDIPLIIYQRAPLTLTPAAVASIAAVPSIVALKDGTGSVDLVQRQRDAVADSEFVFLNGFPTAEIVAPAMSACGVRSYSSALLNMIPEFALDFHDALSRGDELTVDQMIRQVVIPFIALRDRAPGYAVSLIKAGARLRGADAGGVRPPLADPGAADVAALEELLTKWGLAGPMAMGTRSEHSGP